MNAATQNIIFGNRPPVNPALRLLWNPITRVMEPAGMAADFTSAYGDVAVIDPTTPANQVVTDRSWFTQSGTSPKLPRDASGTYAWAAHNIATSSQEFGTGWALGTLVTVSSDAAIAPDGSLTADKVIATSTGGATFRYLYQTKTSVGVNTFSFYAKAAEYYLVRAVDLTNDYWYVTFNLNTGATSASGGSKLISVSMEDVGGGWWRCKIVNSNVASSALTLVGFPNTITPTTQAASYTGDDVSGVYLWGAQLNLGYVPTTYVPTTTAAVYTLAQDFDPTLGWGLLVEPAATNLITYSSQFDNAAWTTAAASVSADSGIAPNGRQEADLIAADGAASQHYVYAAPAVTLNASHVLTLFVKAGTAGFAHVLATVVNAYVQIDLSNGSVVYSSAGTATGFSTTVASIGNGWYRFGIVLTASGVAPSYRIYPLAASQNAAGPSETSTASIYCWNAQLEAGTVATSPIPTAAATVTRAADSITKPLSAMPFSATEGTYYALVVEAATTPSGTLLGLSGSGAAAILNYRSSATAITAVVHNGVDFQTTLAKTTAAALTHHLTHAWKVNDVAYSRNGDALGVDTSAALPTLTTFRIGGIFFTGNAEVLRFSKIVYVPRRVPDADLPTWRYAP